MTTDRRIRLVTAAVALIAIAAGVAQLESFRHGITIHRGFTGDGIPVTVFAPENPSPVPAVVIAHGFAGSQQLMQTFALNLAHDGYVAVTFDFPGHGRNAAPLRGGLKDLQELNRHLLDYLDRAVKFARQTPGADGRVALIGHSMASDVVVRYAMAHPEVVATVAVSLFSVDATASSPRNLLIIDGALEPAMLRNAAFKIVSLSAGPDVQADTTYGRLDAGSGRRVALAPGVEHIGVLYSRASMAEARAWIDASFKRSGSADITTPGPALALMFIGLIALGWPLAGLLPRVSESPSGAGLAWRQLLPVALGPAIVTPLLLWHAPRGFLPLLLGDYLALHFGLYGLLTAAGLVLVPTKQSPGRLALPVGRLSLAIVAAGAYYMLALGGAANRYLTSLWPTPERVPLILALLAGTLPYFLVDEWLTRGPAARRGSFVATKACFLVSLVIAIALNLEQLFFLIIIVPVILILFVVYGMFSGWIYHRTRHPAVAAAVLALAFAWMIAVVFPVVTP